jgi:urease accessory protein
MRWLDVLHVLDSAFPTGAYAHASGLESLAPHDLQTALELRLEESIGRLDLVFVLHAYSRDLVALDEQLHASLLVREPREASSAVGRSLLRSVCDIVPDQRLAAFLAQGTHHHQAVAFGAVACTLNMEPELAAQAYAFNSVRALVSAAQRLGWIGQHRAQRMLNELKPSCVDAARQAMRMTVEDAGAFAPLWDLASMRHEHASARMFAS